MTINTSQKLFENEAPPRTPYHKVYDYNAAGAIIYEGFAQSRQAPATSAAFWAIKSYTYATVLGNVVLVSSQWALGGETNIWDNRAGLTYR